MSISQTYKVYWGAGNQLLGSSYVLSAQSEQNVSVDLANNSQNTPLDIAWAEANLVTLIIIVSAPCTLYINGQSGGSPTDTIALTPNVPFIWFQASGTKYPFTGTGGAVTSAFVTVPNSSPAQDSQFDLRALVNI
jgi:hypothetical protein